MVDQQSVEEGFVAVEELHQKNVALQIRCLPPQAGQSRSICCALVLNFGGRSPRKFSASRSSSVKAVPLFSEGLRRRLMPLYPSMVRFCIGGADTSVSDEEMAKPM
jgi:hypothetical protein